METADYFCGIPPEEQTPEGFVKTLSEARRHAKLLRAELVEALKAIDKLDNIVDKAQQPTLFEEDYHDYATSSFRCICKAEDSIMRAGTHRIKAMESVFDVLRVFMGRRWREIRENRENRDKR